MTEAGGAIVARTDARAAAWALWGPRRSGIESPVRFRRRGSIGGGAAEPTFQRYAGYIGQKLR